MVFKPQTFHEQEPTVEREVPPQAMLETDVAAALAGAGGLDATDVTVTVKGSQANLAGTVLRPQEVTRAEEVALSVPGIRSVINSITAQQPL
jgi:osmotically-inducible protein OsmY